jgi:hypothetical protein
MSPRQWYRRAGELVLSYIVPGLVAVEEGPDLLAVGSEAGHFRRTGEPARGGGLLHPAKIDLKHQCIWSGAPLAP